MKLRKLLWVLLGLAAVVAGCSSPRGAEGGPRAGGRTSRRAGTNAQRRVRATTPAGKVAQINRRMAACGDFDRRIDEFREDLDRLARAAARVAALRATLDEVDKLRATSVHVLGRRVGVWVAICQVSPEADALNPAIAKVNQVVRRCEQIVRLKAVVASDHRIFKDALAKAGARPSEETVAAVREAARGLRTRIALVDRTWSQLDRALAAVEVPLRAGRNVLGAVTASNIKGKAQEIAYRLGRVLAVVGSAREQLRQRRGRTADATKTLDALSAGR